VIYTKGNAVAALIVLSLLLSSALLVTPVSAKTTVRIPPLKAPINDEQFFMQLFQQMWLRLQKGDVAGAAVLLGTQIGSYAASKL
jgi:hypothetical protein